MGWSKNRTVLDNTRLRELVVQSDCNSCFYLNLKPDHVSRISRFSEYKRERNLVDNYMSYENSLMEVIQNARKLERMLCPIYES